MRFLVLLDHTQTPSPGLVRRGFSFVVHSFLPSLRTLICYAIRNNLVEL
jgi:hypothetical protein